MGVVGRFAGGPHTVALDRHGEDDGGLAIALHSRGVGGVNLVGIVPAAIEVLDVPVAQLPDHILQFRVGAEEVLPGVGTAVVLAVLQFAVADLVHALLQQPLVVLLEERIPQAAPDHLDDVPAGAPEHAFQFLDDLAIAPHRTVQPLQVAVDDEVEVVQSFPAGQGDGAQGFRLVALAVAQKRPHLAIAPGRQPPGGQVAHDMRLVDGLDGAQPHGDGGKLPEIGHQPGVGIGGQPVAVHLAAEIVQLLFRQAPLQKGAGVDTGRTVALKIDQIPQMAVIAPPEKVVEPHVIECGGGRERGDMPPEGILALVRPHHHRQGIPAHQRANPPFHEQVPGHALFPRRRDGVAERGGDGIRSGNALVRGLVQQLLDDETGPLRTLETDNGLEGVQPLPGFCGIDILMLRHSGYHLPERGNTG